MTDHLLFQLYGPLASWGGIAVGEIRPSEDRPTKSAVVGLVAAALGLRRDQEDELQALADGLLYAVEVYRPGAFLRDFHTVQVARGTLPAFARTRSDALLYAGEQDANPLVSYREYRSDPYAIVALRVHPGISLPWSLEAIKERIERPQFPLYLGRKACPLALPLFPLIQPAVRFADAFEAAPYRQHVLNLFVDGYGEERGGDLVSQLAGDSSALADVFWEGGPAEWPGTNPIRVERWDRATSRARWEFAPRDEWMLRRSRSSQL